MSHYWMNRDSKILISDADANQYFTNETKKCFVEQWTRIDSFEQYLAHRYVGECYYYSGWALMGLGDDDKLVRGVKNNPHHLHGWTEFIFNDKEFVFDSMVKGVVRKEDWYNYFKPEITHEITKKQLLSKVLTEEFCTFEGNKISVDEKPLGLDDSIKQGMLIAPLCKSKFVMSTDGKKVEKFTSFNKYC